MYRAKKKKEEEKKEEKKKVGVGGGGGTAITRLRHVFLYLNIDFYDGNVSHEPPDPFGFASFVHLACQMLVAINTFPFGFASFVHLACQMLVAINTFPFGFASFVHLACQMLVAINTFLLVLLLLFTWLAKCS